MEIINKIHSMLSLYNVKKAINYDYLVIFDKNKQKIMLKKEKLRIIITNEDLYELINKTEIGEYKEREILFSITEKIVKEHIMYYSEIERTSSEKYGGYYITITCYK